jgi:hypothetical protein
MTQSRCPELICGDGEDTLIRQADPAALIDSSRRNDARASRAGRRAKDVVVAAMAGRQCSEINAASRERIERCRGCTRCVYNAKAGLAEEHGVEAGSRKACAKLADPARDSFDP